MFIVNSLQLKIARVFSQQIFTVHISFPFWRIKAILLHTPWQTSLSVQQENTVYARKAKQENRSSKNETRKSTLVK